MPPIDEHDADALAAETVAPPSGPPRRAEPSAPARLIDGRYQLLRPLASGAMGDVHVALQLSVQREVALKMLRAAGPIGPALEERFRREARAASQLKSDRTVTVLDFGRAEDGTLYLVMELIEGGSLAAAMDAGTLTLDESLQVAMDIAASLHEAHEAGIVHRDLKPQNVLVQTDALGQQRAKLTDFGIASLAEAAGSLTHTGAFLGTPAYSSPEQALGQPVDRRADLYALGVLLFHLVSGAVPFEAPSAAALLVAHAQTPAPPLKANRDGSPVQPHLAQLVRELLEKRPEARPSTAQIVHQRLSEIRQSGRQTQPVRTAATQTQGATAVTVSAPSSLVGRESDLEALVECVLRGDRCVTVAGMGGIGKTRVAVALQQAPPVAHRFGRSLFIDLAAAQRSEDLTRLTATALELALPATASSSDQTARVREALANADATLLVIDNFEQMEPAARDVLADWLTAAPQTQVLVTSREPLDLDEETVYELEPLAEDAAMLLFASRARAASRRFTIDDSNREPIRQLVDRLDGLPLAIELAAAWVPMLSPSQLVQRLSQRFRLLKGGRGKRRALRTVLDQSWELLTPYERRALAHTAVFVKGFDVEAAEHIVELPEGLDPDEPEAPWTLEVLRRLRQKSLIVTEQTDDGVRFRLFETIRDYAAERLQAEGDSDAAAERHCAYYAELTAELADELDGPDGAESLRRLATETPNVRAALARALNTDVEAALSLAAALEAARRSIAISIDELESILGSVIEAAGDQRSLALARALELRAHALWQRRPVEETQGDLNQALELAEGAQDPLRIASILRKRGQLQAFRGDASDAVDDLVRALALFTASPNPEAVSGAARVRIDLGNATTRLRDFEAARAHYREAVVLARRAGSLRAEATALTNLGGIEAQLGHLDDAEASLRAAREPFRRSGDRATEAVLLTHLAGVLVDSARYDEAATILEQANPRHRESGYSVFEAHGHRLVALIALSRGDTDSATSALDEAEALLREANNQRLLAEVRLTRSYVDLERGTPALAATHAEAAAAALEDSRDLPNACRAHFVLAIARALQGDSAGAQQARNLGQQLATRIQPADDRLALLGQLTANPDPARVHEAQRRSVVLRLATKWLKPRIT